MQIVLQEQQEMGNGRVQSSDETGRLPGSEGDEPNQQMGLSQINGVEELSRQKEHNEQRHVVGEQCGECVCVHTCVRAGTWEN